MADDLHALASQVTGLSDFGPDDYTDGLEVLQIYDETAAATDLRRLPEPDEIADAVVFLASPLARAITGQCLDVNCGEYHH